MSFSCGPSTPPPLLPTSFWSGYSKTRERLRAGGGHSHLLPGSQRAATGFPSPHREHQGSRPLRLLQHRVHLHHTHHNRQPLGPVRPYDPIKIAGGDLQNTLLDLLSVQEFAPFIPSTGANPPGDCRSPTCRPFLLGKVVNPGTPRG